nr:hypothetical protein B11C_110186 [Bartonella sp. 1-1C]
MISDNHYHRTLYNRIRNNFASNIPATTRSIVSVAPARSPLQQ